MATDDDPKSVTNTLSTTTADTVKLTQFWDAIEVTNQDSSVALYVTFEGTTAVSAADKTDVIPPNQSKRFTEGIQRAGGTPGSTSSPCHQLSVVGNGNVYTVAGTT